MKVYTHSCENCSLHKVFYENIIIEEDDAKVYNKIMIMVNNSDQAVENNATENLPDSITEADKENYKKIAKKNNDDAHALLAEWWMLMRKKYPGLEDASKFDYNCKKFFKCVNSNGVPSVEGKFIEKK